MSTQKFCHNCGKKLVVGDKFCSGCGTNLASLSSKPTPPPAPSFKPFSVTSEEDDDDEAVDRMTHANIRQTELHVDIIKDRPMNETIGDVVKQSLHSGPPRPEEKFKRPTIDSKQALEAFRKEAGTLRNA